MLEMIKSQELEGIAEEALGKSKRVVESVRAFRKLFDEPRY
jgi:hypothetical protein